MPLNTDPPTYTFTSCTHCTVPSLPQPPPCVNLINAIKCNYRSGVKEKNCPHFDLLLFPTVQYLLRNVLFPRFTNRKSTGPWPSGLFAYCHRRPRWHWAKRSHDAEMKTMTLWFAKAQTFVSRLNSLYDFNANCDCGARTRCSGGPSYIPPLKQNKSSEVVRLDICRTLSHPFELPSLERNKETTPPLFFLLTEAL